MLELLNMQQGCDFLYTVTAKSLKRVWQLWTLYMQEQATLAQLDIIAPIHHAWVINAYGSYAGCTGTGLGTAWAGGGAGAMATGAGEITTGWKTGWAGGAGDVGVSLMCARAVSVGVGGAGANAGLKVSTNNIKYSDCCVCSRYNNLPPPGCA